MSSIFGPRGWRPTPSKTLAMVRQSRAVRTPSTAEGSCGARRASDLEAGTGTTGSVRAEVLGRGSFSQEFAA